MKMRKGLSIFMAIAMVFSYIPATAFAGASSDVMNVAVTTTEKSEVAEDVFKDMPEEGFWSTAALKAAVSYGLLNGFSENDGIYIKGDNPLTRAQMATIVNRAFGAKELAVLSGINDVSANEWYYKDMQKAVKMGTMKSDTLMRPNDSITRQEAFTVLGRALKMKGGVTADFASFNDASQVASWATAGMGAMVKAGYIQGDNNLLTPNASITRAQFATIMNNLIKQYITTAGTVKEVVDGNVMINVPGVTLEDVTITGDLIIGDGVGDGNVTLKSVVVKGDLIARGGGVDSIIITGGSVNGKVIIAKIDGKIRVFAEDGAEIEVIEIDDGKDDVIIEGTVGTVEVTAVETPIVIRDANVKKIDVKTEGAGNITIDKKSKVDSLVIGEFSTGTKVDVAGTVTDFETSAQGTGLSGTGTVTKAKVNSGADNSKIATKGTKITNDGAAGLTDDKGETVDANPTPTPSNRTPAVLVSSISLNKATIKQAGGTTETLMATVEPDNATNKTVTWESSDEDVASVDEDGKVTAIGKGTAIITAKASGFTATCEVTVEIAVGSLSKNHYNEGENLEFTISGLRPSEEISVGMPIKTELGEWASDEKIISGMTEEGTGVDLVRHFKGTTDMYGILNVNGQVQSDLPTGIIYITLPDYGIGINKAVELQDNQGVGVRVGDTVELITAKVNSKGELAIAFGEYNQADYEAVDWTILTGFNTDGIAAIDAATDPTGVISAKTTAINGMAGVKTKAERLAAAKAEDDAEVKAFSALNITYATKADAEAAIKAVAINGTLANTTIAWNGMLATVTLNDGTVDLTFADITEIKRVGENADYKNIYEAINAANDGDTILVTAGIYTEAFNFRADKNGNVAGAAKNLTIKAVGDVTIKNPNPSEIKIGFYLDKNMGTITIDGFKISDFESGISQGYSYAEGTAVHILNNEIWADYTGTMRNGIQVAGNKSIVKGNTIHAEAFVEGWQSTGIMVINAEDVLVENNHMNNNVKIGINVNSYGGDLLAKNIILKNNVINSAQYGIQIQSQGTGRPFEVENIIVEGNVITNNDGANNQGISIYKVKLKDSRFTNNTISEDFTYKILISSGSTLENVELDGEQLVLETGVIMEWTSGEANPKVGETITATIQPGETSGKEYIWKYYKSSWKTAQTGASNTFIPEVASSYYMVDVFVDVNDKYCYYLSSYNTEGYTKVVE